MVFGKCHKIFANEDGHIVVAKQEHISNFV